MPGLNNFVRRRIAVIYFRGGEGLPALATGQLNRFDFRAIRVATRTSHATDVAGKSRGDPSRTTDACLLPEHRRLSPTI